MVAMNGFETNGFEQLAPRRAAGRPTLCVHFATRGVDHVISLTDPAAAPELDRARAARLVIEWDDAAGPLLRGRALLRGEVACDAYLLTGSDPPVADRDLLRAAGLPRGRAALLARMPDRPLLATAARGAEPSPHLLRRIHSLLLADVETTRRTARSA